MYFTFFLAVFICMAAARRARAEQRRDDPWVLLDNLETYVCVSRFDTCEILYANKKTRDEFNMEELSGRKCWEIFKEPAQGPCENCPGRSGMLREENIHVWETYNAKFKRHYKNIESIVLWNGVKAHMRHFMDITESKETEAALEAALENSKHLNNAKSEFLSRMSHEIRTPINAVIGMTKIAKLSKSEQEIQNCLNNIEISGKQLTAIINDIFDVSKLETGTLELVNASFNFKKTMRDVYREFKEQTKYKKQDITLALDEDINKMYIGDEARLSQVVRNLLSNAVKFTPEGGSIVFSARQTDCSGGAAAVKIGVTDSGIGISKENIAKLFSPFEQLDGSKSRKYGGTGLGLALSKNIVEMMGGEFHVQSDSGNGSTFSFTAKFATGNDIQEEPDEEPGASRGEPEKEKNEAPQPSKPQPEEPREAGEVREIHPKHETHETRGKHGENEESGAESLANLTDSEALMPFINVRRGMENLRGNSKLYTVLLGSCQKNDFLEKIQEHLASGRYQEAAHVTGALKNIAVSLGFDDLRGKAVALDESIRGMSVSDAIIDKALSSAEETKKLIPNLILAFKEGQKNKQESEQEGKGQ